MLRLAKAKRSRLIQSQDGERRIPMRLHETFRWNNPSSRCSEHGLGDAGRKAGSANELTIL